jgi:hypothetical protein
MIEAEEIVAVVSTFFFISVLFPQVLVRAVNDHGLSPPSPVSKSLKTLSKVNADGSTDDMNSAKAAEKNPTLVRMK